jgi:orotidine-5'-phosphate decarboxylase
MIEPGQSRLIFALDVPTLSEAQDVIQRLASHVGLFKVGLELFSAAGPDAVHAITRHGGAGVFLDLKLHDIPTTVERAARAIAALGVRMLTVHAEGGAEMMGAAVRGAHVCDPDVCVLAVTRLTSQAATVEEVVELARSAEVAGCGGVICAGTEASAVRKAVSSDFRIVCPGVRPTDSARGDQVRVVTPRQAFLAGADYVVVGRPIRDAADPVQVAQAISAEISRVLGTT